MLDYTKRHFVRMDQHLDEIHLKVFAEEVETDDIHEIQEDSNSIADDVNDIDNALQRLVVDEARGETIEKDVQQVDGKDNGQVKLHSVEIKRQSLSQIELVEKLDVEQIEHPTADAECQQGGQHTVGQQHVWRRKPGLEFLFSRLTTHRFVTKSVAKIRKKLYLCPIIHITKFQS